MLNGSDQRSPAEFWRQLEPLYPRVRAFARHQMPGQWEDLLQEGETKALEGYGSLRDVDRFRPWLFRVISREATRMRRRDFWKRFQPLSILLPGDGEDDHADVIPDPADPASENGQTDQLMRIQLADSLAHLSWDKRQTVLLYYLGGFNLAEIAELRGEGLSATKSRLSRARRELRRLMLEGHPDLSANRRRSEMESDHGVEEWLVMEEEHGQE